MPINDLLFILFFSVSFIGVTICEISQVRYLRSQGFRAGPPLAIIATIVTTARAKLFRRSLMRYLLPMMIFGVVLPVSALMLVSHSPGPLGRVVRTALKLTISPGGSAQPSSYLLGLDLFDWIMLVVLALCVTTAFILQKREIVHIREAKVALMDHWLARGIWFPMLMAFSKMGAADKRRSLFQYFIPCLALALLIFATFLVLAYRRHGIFSSNIFSVFRAIQFAITGSHR